MTSSALQLLSSEDVATIEASAAALSISEAAVASGLSAHTLRYYERAGLMLDQVERAPSSHRRYSARDLHWLALLTRLRRTGMSIRDMRAYAALVRAGEGNELERLDLLEAHRRHVRARLRETQDHLGAIDDKIALYRAKSVTAARRESTTSVTLGDRLE